MYSIGVITYFLLSGSLPFISKTEQEIAKRTIRCELTFGSPRWKSISKCAIDFCSSNSFLLRAHH